MEKLRNTTIMLTLILFSTTLSAQYQSIFGNQQTAWYFNSWVVTLQSIECRPDSAWLGYNQDTIFNGKVFKPHYIMGKTSTTPFQDGFVCEDTTTGEVWYRYGGNFDTSIYKIMDMSLTVNDSFYLDQGIGGFMIAVDSVFYQSGKKHIKLKYQMDVTSGPPSRTTWVNYIMIEGVGVNLMGVSLSIGNAVLKRNWKDNSLNHATVLDSVFYCDSLTTSIIRNEDQNTAFNIFPNPIRETANFTLNEIDAEKVELIDLSGRLIKSFSTKGNELNFSDVRNGVYFVRITTAKQEQFTQKVVVQK